MSECRSCHAPVVFVPSAKSGKSMILDAEPKKGVVLVDLERNTLVDTIIMGGNGRLIVGPAVPDDMRRARVVDVYADHHATCPNAADWKGRTR